MRTRSENNNASFFTAANIIDALLQSSRVSNAVAAMVPWGTPSDFGAVASRPDEYTLDLGDPRTESIVEALAAGGSPDDDVEVEGAPEDDDDDRGAPKNRSKLNLQAKATMPRRDVKAHVRRMRSAGIKGVHARARTKHVQTRGVVADRIVIDNILPVTGGISPDNRGYANGLGYLSLYALRLALQMANGFTPRRIRSVVTSSGTAINTIIAHPQIGKSMLVPAMFSVINATRDTLRGGEVLEMSINAHDWQSDDTVVYPKGSVSLRYGKDDQSAVGFIHLPLVANSAGETFSSNLLVSDAWGQRNDPSYTARIIHTWQMANGFRADVSVYEPNHEYMRALATALNHVIDTHM